ncbi:glycosyltransferase [Treponema socranskii]|uniref:glycosyltransferase family 2 protein n=1 Tax=Treponema socranskii TaxID=53419 RepID=UPI003D8C52C9
MSDPLVTVLLPVYNRPAVIKTIGSILQQTYTKFELLIIDNASTDNTVEEIKKINDKRIKLVVNEKNRGQTYSLNKGLELATGKYIARIDSDDIALPTRLEKQVAFLENNPDYGLCGCWVQYINDDDQLTITMKTPTTDKGLRLLQNVTCGMYHPASMFRTEIILKNHIAYESDIKMAEDYALWGKIMQFSKALNLPEVLLYYRRGNSNDSEKYRETMARESFIVREMICRNQIDDSTTLSQMLNVIGIEKKEKKSIFDFIFVLCFYYYYLNKNFSKTELDYVILKRTLILKVYSSSIAVNRALYAKFLKYIYKKLLKFRYKYGKKI